MGRAMAIALLALSLMLGAQSAQLSADLVSVQSDEEWKERPIAKVIRLLEDMKAQLEIEAKKDEEMYDQMVCWCETNDKEKTKAIADNTEKIKVLGTTIEESSASAKSLETEIGELKTGIEELEKALLSAEEIRDKELAEFNAREKDTIASLQSLKGAIVSLSKANAGSAIQTRQALIQVQQVLRKQPSEAVAAVAPHNRAAVRAFLENPARGESLLQETASLDVKQAPSGAIFGMLNQMKETFESDMETGKKEEAKSAEEYASLKATKSQELAASKGKVETKTAEMAAAKATAAKSSQDLDDTEDTLEADTEFLKNLKVQCKDIDAEFEARRKARTEELVGVSETMEILTSDEANDTMTKSMSLFQARAQSKREGVAREAVADFLDKKGKKLKSARISYLAVRVRNDAFAKIKENIDMMVGELGKEQKDEGVKKDDCNTDLNTNTKQTSERTSHKDDVESEINTLEAEIGVLTDEEKMIEQTIADSQIELKKAGENRETENKDFQMTISDQRATQAILEKALKRMQEVYDKKADAFLQVKRAHRSSQEPPVKFEKQEQNAGGGGVITMLTGIIDESKAVEKDAISAETDATIAYEQFVKDTNKAIEKLQAQFVNDEEIKSKDEAKDVEDKGDRSATVKDILTLGDVSQTLHGACDFTIKNFDTRQHARSDEMDALKESKTIFGAAAASLVQASSATTALRR